MAWNNLPQPYLTKGEELTIFQISNSANIKVEKLPSIMPRLKEETILSTRKRNEATGKKFQKQSKPSDGIKDTKSRNNKTSTNSSSLQHEDGYIYHHIRRK